MLARQATALDAPEIAVPSRAALVRRLAPAAAVLGAAALVTVVAPGVARVFADAVQRALDADPRWVVAAVGLEMLSVAGYILLFWHVAGRSTPRIGLRASAAVSLAGTAVTRLLPTAGAGGAALTWWSLRRAGQGGAEATRTLLTFLVVLYSVFLAALLAAGTVLALDGGVAFELAALPAAAAATAIAVALLVAARHRPHAEAPDGRVGQAAHALGAGVRGAFGVVGRPHARLLGAPAWWGFDMLVLWAMLNALGHAPPPAVLVLGYFLGQVANTIPVPGAASGGMAGAFIALGVAPAVALPAVLAYRAIAIWTPVPIGAAALGSLRRTFRRWAEEDAAPRDLPARSPQSAEAALPCTPARSRRPAGAATPASRRPTRTLQPSSPRSPPRLRPAPSLSAATSGSR
jgi:uncharacterized membrane protein YbhN (UPF0104 family)